MFLDRNITMILLKHLYKYAYVHIRERVLCAAEREINTHILFINN